MESADILQTVSEIAMGLAGFGGVAAGLGYRTRGEWRADDQLRLMGMARTSLLVVFAGLLPFLIHNLGFGVPWKISAIIVFPFQVANLAGVLWVFRHGISRSYNRVASFLLLFVQIVAVGVLVVLSTNIELGSQFGLYLLAVVFMLINAALLFFRLLATSFLEISDAT